MILSISKDGTEWSPDFGPDSIFLTVKNLVQELKICSQESPLATCSLLLSQRQDFVNIHLARVPLTPKHEGTKEMRDEVLSSVAAQDMETNGYQKFDLDDVELC